MIAVLGWPVALKTAMQLPLNSVTLNAVPDIVLIVVCWPSASVAFSDIGPMSIGSS